MSIDSPAREAAPLRARAWRSRPRTGRCGWRRPATAASPTATCWAGCVRLQRHLVRLSVVGDAGSEQMVCTGIGRGSKFIGPWLKPGMAFLLRDNVDDAVIGRVVFEG